MAENLKLSNPLIVRFKRGSGQVQANGNTLEVPAFSRKQDTQTALKTALDQGNYDYIALSFNNAVDPAKNNGQQMNGETLRALNMRANWFMDAKDKNDQVLPVINHKQGSDQLYLLNPQYDKETRDFVAAEGATENSGKAYKAPSEVVKDVYEQYPDQDAWEKHQADVLNKFAAINPLSEEHQNMLKDPKRGLSQKGDLDGFFDWRSNQPVIPELMDDNMVGIPSIKATSFSNVDVSANGHEMGTGTLLNLKTGGKSGFMIPMRNPNGDSPKYQVAADVSKINLILKAKAADGVSIDKSEYYDKKQNKYLFKLKDGQDSDLKLVKANNQGATFEDKNGEFDVGIKEDIKPKLEERGYDIPKIIDNIKPIPQTKYIWMSRGDMIGPKNAKPDVSPSNPGFITAKKPTNGENKYVVVVAEGALKGVITSKYATRPDKNGKTLAGRLAGNRGLIVAQVPGVAESFVKDVPRVYKGKEIAGTYIAMDADGRDNRNVAKGIAGAYKALNSVPGQEGKVTVLSWDPAQKGIDDALLAMNSGKITLEDMDLQWGTPEKLFPIDKAESKIPYKLDGTRKYGEDDRPEWQVEYSEQVKADEAKYKQEAQNSDQNIDLLGEKKSPKKKILTEHDSMDLPANPNKEAAKTESKAETAKTEPKKPEPAQSEAQNTQESQSPKQKAVDMIDKMSNEDVEKLIESMNQMSDLTDNSKDNTIQQ